ncbi:hypothetical protein LguiB_026365 [Lonicera macranthoides]
MDKEDECDFKVKGRWFERSCNVYASESLTIIAPPLIQKKTNVILKLKEGDVREVATYMLGNLQQSLP